MDINRIILSGRLTKDPELRYTPNGIAVCTFTLAVDRPFTNNKGERETDFHDIVTWRQLAETCANYLRKGQESTVDGRLQNRFYENNENRKVKVTEIVAENVKFGAIPKGQSQDQSQGSRQNTSSNQSSNRNSAGAGATAGYRAGSGQGQGSSKSSFNDDPFTGQGKEVDINDDDLPF